MWGVGSTRAPHFCRNRESVVLYPEQNEARLKLSLDSTWAFALGSCVEDQFDPQAPAGCPSPAVPASYNDQSDQTTALRRHYGWA